jgi:hypothetical protein
MTTRRRPGGPGRTGARALAPLLLALLVLAGCGGEVSVGTKKPTELKGTTLAKRANAQLVKQNPQLSQGTLTCADVKYEVDATSRCLRTVVLEDGRLVRIGATVTIDKTTGTGHFGIQVDKEAKEFGLVGKAVAADLAAQYAKRFGTKAPEATCPAYLAGKVGTTMTCRLVTEQGKLAIVVTVKSVKPASYETVYTFKSSN